MSGVSPLSPAVLNIETVSQMFDKTALFAVLTGSCRADNQFASELSTENVNFSS
jgi:hypothetical protein